MKWIICLLNQTPQRTAVEEILENYRSYTKRKTLPCVFQFYNIEKRTVFLDIEGNRTRDLTIVKPTLLPPG